MKSRWACTVCWTEGEGTSPGECPTCGTPDAWYERVTTDDRPLREHFREMVARMTVERALGILDRAPDVPPDLGDEMPES